MKEYKGSNYEKLKITVKNEDGDIVDILDPVRIEYETETKTLKVSFNDENNVISTTEFKKVTPLFHYRNKEFFG